MLRNQYDARSAPPRALFSSARMRKLRLALGASSSSSRSPASSGSCVGWISRQRTEEALVRQAAEIAAHRQAQRAESPVTPSVTSVAAAPAPDSRTVDPHPPRD